jgi:hypothetical protein
VVYVIYPRFFTSVAGTGAAAIFCEKPQPHLDAVPAPAVTACYVRKGVLAP